MLIQLWDCRAVSMRNWLALCNRVRRLNSRQGVRLEKAALYFRCQGRGVLLGKDGAFHDSIDCYDTTWSGHLEFEIGIVRHRIETCKCGSSEQCMLATAEGDDVKD